jgi:regulatory protein
MTEVNSSDVRRAAMDLLARREHSHHEIVLKLTRRFGDHPEFFEQEIGKLTNEGLQSNRRLAEAYIRSRTNRGQGPVKIRMELRAKKVGDETISTAFEECGIDFSELAQSVAGKKFGDELGKATDMKTRARISRFMQQRGFSYDHISCLY